MIVKTNSQIASGGFSLAGTAWQPNATLSVFGGQSNPNARGGAFCALEDGSWGNSTVIFYAGGGTYTDANSVTKSVAIKFKNPSWSFYSLISTDGYLVVKDDGTGETYETRWRKVGLVAFPATSTIKENYTDAALIQWLKANMALVNPYSPDPSIGGWDEPVVDPTAYHTPDTTYSTFEDGVPIPAYTEQELDDYIANSTRDDEGKMYIFMGETTERTVQVPPPITDTTATVGYKQGSIYMVCCDD